MPGKARRTVRKLRGTYLSPLAARYAGKQMNSLFSAETRITCWRLLWIVLAESQKELGVKIPEGVIEALENHLEHVDFEKAAAYEADLRHDVMAHLHAFADCHPEARPWLHLGATSCFITDNADLLILREALVSVRESVYWVIQELADFADKYRLVPTLGYTHFQPAQPTTVGKRACLWLQDLFYDFEELGRIIEWLPLRGAKGTTGTQASFLSVFAGDHNKVKALDQRIAEKLEFDRLCDVTGQTYPRKIDSIVLNALSQVAQSAAKAGNDFRLLAHEREIEEPYGRAQIGSSAMPHKRNPMRAERMCSLARTVIHLAGNTAETAVQQWLERTLDDSANRRLTLAEAFLATDAVLRSYQGILRGLIVNEAVVAANLAREIPFLCTEDVLMRATVRGGDRQTLHDQLRVHARAAVERIKAGARDNDLFERLKADPAFQCVVAELEDIAEPSRLVGRAPEQVAEFLEQRIWPVLKAFNPDASTRPTDMSV